MAFEDVAGVTGQHYMLCFTRGVACAVQNAGHCYNAARLDRGAAVAGVSVVEQQGWQILIVEDDQRLAELTREYLEANGLRVAIESDGAQAVARILREPPALVTLALMLPGEDGLSICRTLRSQHYPGAILMLTARGDEADRVAGLDAGADRRGRAGLRLVGEAAGRAGAGGAHGAPAPERSVAMGGGGRCAAVSSWPEQP